MQPTSNTTTRILRLPDVKTRTGLSRSAIYDGLKKGTFPRCISLGARSVGWLEAEINEWIAARINASRSVLQKGAHADTKQ